MKRERMLKEFAKYTSLNVLGMVGLSCYILADTFFVAQGLGTNGLAALNLAIPVYSFLHGSGLMLGMGGGTSFSIRKGKGDHEGANRVFTQTMRMAGILAAGFFAAGLLLADPIARLLGAEGVVREMSKTYLQVILLFAPMFLLNNVLLCFVRNDGGPQRAMVAMMSGSLANIVLDYLFIFPLEMGIFGAVLATGIAPVISILTLSGHVFQKRCGFRPEKTPWSWPLAGEIASGGVPSLITEASSGVVMIVFNGIIMRLQGNVGVAAYGVIANLSLVVIAVYTGIAQGIQPMLSRSHGAGNGASIRMVLRWALTAMLILSVALHAGIFFGAESITAAFNKEQNELLATLAKEGLRLYFTAIAFCGFNVVVSVYFTATAHPRPAHLISVLRGCALIVPLAFLLAHIGGMIGVWMAFPITELLTALVGGWILIAGSASARMRRGFLARSVRLAGK